MSDAKNVLVICTAEFCGACKSFKKNGNLAKIKDHFASSSKVTVVEIHLNNTNDRELKNSYPQFMHRYVKFFPCFFLANKSWYDQIKNQDVIEKLTKENKNIPDQYKLQLVGMGLPKNNNGLTVENDGRPNSEFSTKADDVIAWVERELKNNTNFQMKISHAPTIGVSNTAVVKSISGSSKSKNRMPAPKSGELSKLTDQKTPVIKSGSDVKQVRKHRRDLQTLTDSSKGETFNFRLTDNGQTLVNQRIPEIQGQKLIQHADFLNQR